MAVTTALTLGAVTVAQLVEQMAAPKVEVMACCSVGAMVALLDELLVDASAAMKVVVKVVKSAVLWTCNIVKNRIVSDKNRFECDTISSLTPMTAQLSVGKMAATMAAMLVFDTVVYLVEKKAVVSVGMTVEQKVS